MGLRGKTTRAKTHQFDYTVLLGVIDDTDTAVDAPVTDDLALTGDVHLGQELLVPDDEPGPDLLADQAQKTQSTESKPSVLSRILGYRPSWRRKGSK